MIAIVGGDTASFSWGANLGRVAHRVAADLGKLG
jgi:hypothetical protein